ncbi:hypothetical protein NSE01_24140 [Novosphingobium sediminis]|uniref:Uncharacterized protein n=1 Tax=Novosphingobium sediminis TaxID=707214 RepID=A0A512ALI3_9SPHN|nr:hypothetical protein [Novosphingobium sediminis]GEO00582.1 hypothetical protein NSE01_24140 [Novosphingobium sediminis]
MDKFRIRWVDSMHTGDDFELILQALEVGLDEGPIISVPRQAARRLGTKVGADYQALVFDNPDWLGAHLMEHRDQLDQEIWLGVCEDVPRDRRQNATAALWHFAKLINELAGRNRKLPRPARAASSAPLVYGAVEESPTESVEAVLEQSGEAFESMASEYKDFPASILISRA